MERKEGGGGISTKRNSIRIKLEVQMIVCCLGLLTWLLTLRLSLYILMLFTVFSWSVRKIFCLTNNPQPRASGEFPRPRANIFPVKPSQLENNMCIIRALIQRLITFHFFFFFRWYVQIITFTENFSIVVAYLCVALNWEHINQGSSSLFVTTVCCPCDDNRFGWRKDISIAYSFVQMTRL